MKCYLILLLLVISNISPMFSSGNMENKTYTLEAAINNSVNNISKLVTNGTIAVINEFLLNGNENLQITRWLENGLLQSGKLDIISRQQINKVKEEQNLGMSSYVDDKSA